MEVWHDLTWSFDVSIYVLPNLFEQRSELSRWRLEHTWTIIHLFHTASGTTDPYLPHVSTIDSRNSTVRHPRFALAPHGALSGESQAVPILGQHWADANVFRWFLEVISSEFGRFERLIWLMNIRTNPRILEWQAEKTYGDDVLLITSQLMGMNRDVWDFRWISQVWTYQSIQVL